MAERGRNELMRAVGLDVGDLFAHRRLGLALRSVDMKFHIPALFDDRLTIRTTVEKLGAASSTWISRIRRGRTLVCTVRAELVCMDRFSGRPILYPEDVQGVFERVRAGIPACGREVVR